MLYSTPDALGERRLRQTVNKRLPEAIDKSAYASVAYCRPQSCWRIRFVSSRTIILKRRIPCSQQNNAEPACFREFLPC